MTVRPASAPARSTNGEVAKKILRVQAPRAPPPSGGYRRPPRLPQHVASSALDAKSAFFVASSLTKESAKQWSSAWSGSPAHRKAPSGPTLDANVKSQASAGGLLMQIALSRPTAIEAWHSSMIEAEKDGSRLWRLRLHEERRAEAERINSAILQRPAPKLNREWQPPSPSRVAGGWGRNYDGGSKEEPAALEAQRLKEKRERAEEQLKEEMQAKEKAEAEWWEWYLKGKQETQEELARRAAEEAKAEIIRLQKMEDARQAKMERMRREEAIRKAKLKEDAERVEKANAEQQRQRLAAEEDERKRKAQEVKAARRKG